MALGFGVGIQRLGSFHIGTLAELQVYTPAAGIRPAGYVYADPNPANNGVWAWSGSAWSRKRGLPDSLAVLTSIGGTANAITATAPPQVDPATVAMVILEAVATNTGAVTLNGAPVRDSAGNALPAGALSAGRSYLLRVVGGGTSYRVLMHNLGQISDIAGLQALLDTKLNGGGGVLGAGVNAATVKATGFHQLTTTNGVPAGFDNGQLITSRGGDASIAQIIISRDAGRLAWRSGGASAIAASDGTGYSAWREAAPMTIVSQSAPSGTGIPGQLYAQVD